MPARLTLLHSNRPARVWTAQEGRAYQLGRDPTCDLVVDDDRVSRHHAELEGDAAGWWVRDLGSKNGIAVDGQRTSRAALKDARWLSLGGLPVRFEAITAAELQSEVASEARRRRTTIDLTKAPARKEAGGRPAASLLESARRLVDAERAFLLVLDGDGPPRVEAAAGIASSDPAVAFAGSFGAVEQVLAAQRAVVSADLSTLPSLSGRESVRRQEISALACLPLRLEGRIVGILYADSRREGRVFTELDLELLTALADHLALALAGARLSSELAQISGALTAPAGGASGGGTGGANGER